MKLTLIALVAGFCLVVGLPMAATAGPATSADGADGDGVGQAYDNCLTKLNAAQVDTDHDGCGDFCDFDWNNSGTVKGAEITLAASQVGKLICGPLGAPPCPGPPYHCCVCDFNHDGICKGSEITAMVGYLNKQPGTSGVGWNASCNSTLCGCTTPP